MNIGDTIMKVQKVKYLILDNFEAEVKKGQRIAIVGENG